MMTLLITVHLIISVLLIGAVLIQSGKGSSMSNVFGGGGMETVFGAETPAIMNKITTTLAIFFMVSCLLLTTFSSRFGGGSSVIQKELQKKMPSTEAPAAPGGQVVPQTRTAPAVPPAQNVPPANK